MSRYKVIQDIEAEDKLLGPLTLRQFIFGIVALMFYYFCYLLYSKGAGIFIILFLPIALFATFFAIPFGGDQPTEIWALAKLRFILKPRRRIWDQSGIKELVTVTAPKKVEEIRTNGLSQQQVRSRLSALATTIDSRGWAVKNVNLNLNDQMAQQVAADLASDRLVNSQGLPQEVPNIDVQAADDIMDEQSNPIAQQFDQMIAASTQAHREQIMAMMQRVEPAAPVAGISGAAVAAPPPTWFTQPPLPAATPTLNGVPQAADPTAEEEALALRLKAEHDEVSPAYSHLKTLQPIDDQAGATVAATTQVTTSPANDQAILDAEQAVAAAIGGPTPVADQPDPVAPPVATAPHNPAILELAHNNDLNVATLARQANQSKPELPDEGEVVIALH